MNAIVSTGGQAIIVINYPYSFRDQENPSTALRLTWQRLCVTAIRCMCSVVSLSRMRCSILMLLSGSLLAFAPLSSIATGNVTLAWDPNPDPSVAGYNL